MSASTIGRTLKDKQKLQELGANTKFTYTRVHLVEFDPAVLNSKDPQRLLEELKG